MKTAALGIMLGILAGLVIGNVRAADKPQYTCADIKAAVKTIEVSGSLNHKRAMEIIEAMARERGATNAQIDAARKCLQ